MFPNRRKYDMINRHKAQTPAMFNNALNNSG